MTADNKSTLIAIDNLCRPSKLDVGISKSIHAKSAKWIPNSVVQEVYEKFN